MLACLLLCAAAAPCTIVIPTEIGQDAPGSVTSLNPLIGDTIDDLQARLLLYRPLVWPGANAAPDPERSLAARIEVLDHRTRFRITLKPWLWSDGAPVLADDVRFCWELIVALGPVFQGGDQGGLRSRVRGVDVLDAHRLDIVLTAPVNAEWFTLNALTLVYALPRHAWGHPSVDEMWRRQTDPAMFTVVDGPFRLERLALDRYLALGRNPLYGGHRPAYGRLVLDFLEGQDALAALQGGQIDMAHAPFALIDRLKRAGRWRMVALPPSWGYRAILLNQENPAVAALRDVRVRRALVAAVDAGRIISLVFHGRSQPVRTGLPPQADATPAAPADPALAARLLDQAGWRRGPDGVRRQGHARLAFSVLISAEQPDVAEEAQVASDSLRAVGVEMRLREVSLAQLLATVLGPDPAAWEAAVLATVPPGFPSGEDDFGAQDPSGFADPRLEQLIAESATAPDRAPLAAFADRVAALAPRLFLPEGNFMLLVAPGIGGVADFANPLGYWSPEYLTKAGEGCGLGR